MAKDTASESVIFDNDPAFREILEFAKSLQTIYKQIYIMIRPVINDACKNPQTISEHELEHLFDQVLDISCTDFGMSLFTMLCDTFKGQYPETVADYIKFNNEIYGDGEKEREKAEEDCHEQA